MNVIRLNLYAGLLGFLIVVLGPSCANKTQQAHDAEQQAKPNIILFIADDLSLDDIGPYGNKVVRTPNLDQLASNALRFTRAFAGSPTCGPSRSTMFTGLMPFRHGAHGNHSGVRAETRSLVHHLQPLGYKVAIAGKLHVGPESVFPFERVSGTNVPEPGFEKKPGLRWDLNMDRVDAWLSEQKEAGPFLLIVADHSPHVIWPDTSTYNPDQIDVPSVHIDTKETRGSRARYYEDITKMDRNVGKLLSSLNRNNLAENTMLVFTADQGAQWPFAKWSLYDDGVQVPMMVRWPGHVKPGTDTDAMVSQVDLLPTFVEVAGGDAPEGIDGRSFIQVITGEKETHRDVVFATHTGDRMMNRSPARMLRTERYKYILNLAPENVYHTHMDKAKDHDGGRRYWGSWEDKAKSDAHAAAVLQRYHHHPEEELYDITADPDEIHNLAADPQYAEMISDFRKQLATWRESQGDAETGPEVISHQPAKGEKPVAPYVFTD